MSVPSIQQKLDVQHPQIHKENLNWERFTPREKYLKLTEIVKELGLYRPRHKVKKQTADIEFQMQRIEFSPTAVGVGGFFATYGISKTLSDIFAKLKPDPDLIYRSIEKDPSKIEKVLKTTGEYSPQIALASGAIVGAIVYYRIYNKSFNIFEVELKKEINDLLHAIEKCQINSQELIAKSNAIFQKRQSAYFRTFETSNSLFAANLLIICGIAYDSNKQSDLAQERYNAALNGLNNDQLRPKLYYLLARSFRLSGNEDLARAQIARIEQIAPNTPFDQLGKMELAAIGNVEEIFNDEGIPFSFICPITQEIIDDPAVYNIGNQTLHFERNEIANWIETKHTCPITRQQLTLEDLREDQLLIDTIHAWKQTQLING